MKKTFQMLFVALTALSMLCFATSCSDDDDDDNDDVTYSAANAEDIAGSYTGTVSMYLQEMPSFELPDLNDATFTIIAQENGLATISVPSVSYNLNGQLLTIYSFTVEDLKVTKGSDGKYYLAETEIEKTVEGMDYTGRLKGVVSGNSITVDYSIKPGRMPMWLISHYEGVRD